MQEKLLIFKKHKFHLLSFQPFISSLISITNKIAKTTVKDQCPIKLNKLVLSASTHIQQSSVQNYSMRTNSVNQFGYQLI